MTLHSSPTLDILDVHLVERKQCAETLDWQGSLLYTAIHVLSIHAAFLPCALARVLGRLISDVNDPVDQALAHLGA